MSAGREENDYHDAKPSVYRRSRRGRHPRYLKQRDDNVEFHWGVYLATASARASPKRNRGRACSRHRHRRGSCSDRCRRVHGSTEIEETCRGRLSSLARPRSTAMIDHIDYRLAFILPNSRQLLGQQVSETIDLPIVSTSMWRRPAEQLTTQIEEQWQIKSIVLDVIAGAGGDAPPCAVVEVRSPDWNFECDGFRTVDVSII